MHGLLEEFRNGGFPNLFIVFFGIFGLLLGIAALALAAMRVRAARIVGVLSAGMAIVILSMGAMGVLRGRSLTDGAISGESVSAWQKERIKRQGYLESKSCARFGLGCAAIPLLAGGLAMILGARKRRDDEEATSLAVPGALLAVAALVAAGDVALLSQPLPGRDLPPMQDEPTPGRTEQDTAKPRHGGKNGDSGVARGVVKIGASIDRSLAKGPLAVLFLTRAEADDIRAKKPMPMGLIAALLEQRAEPIGDVDLRAEGATASFSLSVPRDEELEAFAVLERGGGWLDSLSGGGAGNLSGRAPLHVGDTNTIVLDTIDPKEPTTPEACSGPRRQLIVLEAPRLSGPHRRFCALLPPSYEASPKRRYPIVYLLPGQGGAEMAFLRPRREIDRIADEAATETGREAILIGVDGSTPYGSTYFTASTLQGDFESFFLKEAIPAIESKVRALPNARALLGQSTGGFNVMTLGLRHPERFGAIEALSPDQLDFPTYFLADDATMKTERVHEMRLDDAMGGQGQMTSYAADWSIDPRAKRGFAWPIDLQTGKLVQPVWKRWLAQSPAELVKRPELLAAVKAHLDGRIRITVAKEDEFALYEPARVFSEQLAAAGVKHDFVVTTGGHVEGIMDRERAGLIHALGLLDRAAP